VLYSAPRLAREREWNRDVGCKLVWHQSVADQRVVVRTARAESIIPSPAGESSISSIAAGGNPKFSLRKNAALPR
jgi:hypothetical protein